MIVVSWPQKSDHSNGHLNFPPHDPAKHTQFRYFEASFAWSVQLVSVSHNELPSAPSAVRCC